MISASEGVALRDIGINMVLDSQSNDWKENAREHTRLFIETRESGSYFTGEDVRVFAQKIVGNPSHPNAWGGIIRGALLDYLNQERIVIDGVVQASQKTAHGRLYPRYKVI